jgi:CheY-like chemotaxis protein
MLTRNKILVVDDEHSLVQLCQIVLESAGYKVRGANNGQQALAMIGEDKPDLVLLDVMMPGMDGIEVCQRIRAQDGPDYPRIVMYTADERDTTRLRSLAAGANALLTKETPIFELPTKINHYLS